MGGLVMPTDDDDNDDDNDSMNDDDSSIPYIFVVPLKVHY